MSDNDPAAAESASIRSLSELFERDSKRFEWMAKQYYDLFAYHAAQRLTAFNFFLVSLSFFSTAYATLISKSDNTTTDYFPVAGALASAAYLLVVAFGRLDKRNEQIIGINEKPLIRIQRAIRLGLSQDDELGDEVWETFVQADRSVPLRTFGHLLPIIYSLAATACAAGAMYGFSGPGDLPDYRFCSAWIVLTGVAVLLITRPLFKPRTGQEALDEASKVIRHSTVSVSGAASGAGRRTPTAAATPAFSAPADPAPAAPIPDQSSRDEARAELRSVASSTPATAAAPAKKPGRNPKRSVDREGDPKPPKTLDPPHAGD